MLSLKFGGTSMGSVSMIRQVMDIIRSKTSEKKMVTVSATSGTTNLLLEAFEFAKNGEDFSKEIQMIYEKHEQMVYELLPENQWKKTLNFFTKELEKTTAFLESIVSIKPFPSAVLDPVIAIGERFSAYLLAQCLKDLGAVYCDLSHILTSDYDRMSIDVVLELEANIAEEYTPLLETKNIPIFTGFFGKLPRGILASMGRGYSDYCSALVASALRVDSLEIWTDVKGVLSTDPRIVPHAHRIDTLSFSEALELASFGAKVLHPKTVRPAIRSHIPLWIKSTKYPEDRGTLIQEEHIQGEHLCKAIAIKKGITIFSLFSHKMIDAAEFLPKVFEVCRKYHMNIDLVTTSEITVALTFDNPIEKIRNVVQQLESFGNIELFENKAIIALVGEEMRQKSGVGSRLFGPLGMGGINTEMVSVAANGINASIVVDERDIKKAVRILHEQFFEKE